MVVLRDDIIDPTIALIDKHVLAENKEWDSIGLAISVVGNECDRAIWYSHRWAVREELTADKLRIFESGRIYEDRMMRELALVPEFTVHTLDPQTGRQRKVSAIGGHLRGKLDGIVLGLPEAPKKWHVVECKSHNDSSFSKLLREGVKKSKPDHWWQCQLYMERTGLDRCLYYARNKNNDRPYVERIELDALAVMQQLARVEKIIKSEHAPNRIRDTEDKYPCLFCKFKDVCFRVDFGRKHCRSCLHSTPVVDASSTEAAWECAFHGTGIDLDTQAIGCHAHLFHPAFVPGEQVDAGKDYVVYAMSDRSEWTNRREPEPVRYWYDAMSGLAFETKGQFQRPEGVNEITKEEFDKCRAG